MILGDIEKEIGTKSPEGIINPQYGGYCFASIPSAVEYLFGLKKTSPLSQVLDRAGIFPSDQLSIVALLIDGFGYSQWLKYADKYEFLKRFTDNGVLAPVTAVFPSTTAASLTTMHSGLTPQEHGLLEWWVYFRELGKVIVTLPFMPLGGKIQDQLLSSGVDPRILFDGKTRYVSLSESGIRSFNLIHSSIANSAYSSLVFQGSEVVPFGHASDLMTRLNGLIADVQSPAYFQVYWGDIDSAAHEYGPHSRGYLAELDEFFSQLTRGFLGGFPSNRAEQTIMLVMADHGEISVDPGCTIYLNEYQELVDGLRTGPDGEKILPWGSGRDVFVGVRQEKRDEVFEFLSISLEGKATVVRSEKALRDGLFGRGELHREFTSRIGDILILPRGNLTLHYERPYQRKFTMLGMHGGLSRDEMLVPFAAARVSELI